MTPIVFWLALACGVGAGYEPTSDGHLEYIIQIEPQMVGTLAAGRDMSSEVPRGLDIRHYRLTVGTATLPRIASAARPAPGSSSQRMADQFEAPGRSDEAVGAATPQVHVGYQALGNGGGQFVIEIDPSTLNDLSERDLTGDIPPGLAISRFVVSTNPGTVPGEAPNRLAAGATTTQTGMQPIIETGATTTDDDPSPWKAEPPSGPTGSGAALGATAATPSGPSTIPTAAGPGGIPSMAAVPGGPTPAATGAAPTLGTIPDDNPGGSEQPPAAMPPPAGQVVAPPSTSPLLGQPLATPSQIDPPGGSFRHRGAAAAEDTSPGYTPNNGGAPATLPGGGTSAPLNAGFNEPGSRQGQFGGAQNQPGIGQTHLPPAAAEKLESSPGKNESGHKTAGEQPVPYLPLSVVTCGLLFSVGVNVFLGWHVWESYNRPRAAEHPPREDRHREKKHERKTSLAH